MILTTVFVRALVAALHYLALGIGLASVFARGLRLRDLRASPGDTNSRARLLRADAVWGIAALLWIATGLLRAFAGLDKEPAFYLRNGFFHVKMGLFALVLVLELRPMITFIRWRRTLRRSGATNPVESRQVTALIPLNDAEVATVVIIPFVAALMARGAWLF